MVELKSESQNEIFIIEDLGAKRSGCVVAYLGCLTPSLTMVDVRSVGLTRSSVCHGVAFVSTVWWAVANGATWTMRILLMFVSSVWNHQSK